MEYFAKVRFEQQEMCAVKISISNPNFVQLSQPAFATEADRHSCLLKKFITAEDHLSMLHQFVT